MARLLLISVFLIVIQGASLSYGYSCSGVLTLVSNRPAPSSESERRQLLVTVFGYKSPIVRTADYTGPKLSFFGRLDKEVSKLGLDQNSEVWEQPLLDVLREYSDLKAQDPKGVLPRQYSKEELDDISEDLDKFDGVIDSGNEVKMAHLFSRLFGMPQGDRVRLITESLGSDFAMRANSGSGDDITFGKIISRNLKASRMKSINLSLRMLKGLLRSYYFN
jgi:hypothetical protein